MREVEPLRSRVDRVLGEYLAARLDEVGTPGGGAGDGHRDLAEREFVSQIADLITRGGKRLRSVLSVLGSMGTGAAADDEIVRASACLELLHACALIHDDVMDRSETRRGGATVHRWFAARHADGAWRGDAVQFGAGAAIAAGDLCLVWADRLLRESGLAAAALERGRPVYDAMRAETIRGQYLDLAAQAGGWFDLDDALTVARAKTAACTTTGPLRFGGTLAGASADLLAAYEAYGLALGLAFQLRDDLLGAFADPAVIGKPSGDDLRDGKCTVLLAETYQRLDPPGRLHLRRLTDAGERDAVPQIRGLMIETGARDAVQERIEQLGKRAVEALGGGAGSRGGVAIDAAVRESLTGLVGAVTED
ncbi:polyprenyl synthetase family protein [Actinocrinis puniceicyclus]|uniref:Polyprenyl synthetase family protein n=1 Tax=Actinocrinis puniceicyclus TaxID=977794 RepID=A0A8J8BEL0_9ACTN|nr:polyprenyl synthetase family protein [Actinocrinis puniceicyclus]MBS2965665.1 polyprenyl synthetase family protein [Actinocrinis puniceicyclus]